jgi:hypothetical protein
MTLDPVCAIHGKRWSEHDGGRCLYCCICYRPLTHDECAVDGDGDRWDVCAGACAAEAGIVEQGLAGPASEEAGGAGGGPDQGAAVTSPRPLGTTPASTGGDS